MHAGIASADPKHEAAAQVLFDEARKLVAAGDSPAACPKFEESQRLDPSLGTQLNIALCYQATGRSASAWTLFREVEAVARRNGDAKRAQFARLQAEALEPKLSRVTIRISESAMLKGLTVSRDGVVVGDAQYDTAVPVDRGTHVITATAPGRRTWETKLDVNADAMQLEVIVPVLDKEARLALENQRTSPAIDVQSESTAERSALGRQRVFAIGAGVLALSGYGIATYLGFQARSHSDLANAEDWCIGKSCTEEGVKARDRAGQLARLGTVVGVVSTVALASGVVLWFTAPKSGSPRTGFRAAPGGASLTGTF